MSNSLPDELVDYPVGQVQIGAGDLQHSASAKATFKNGAKLVHTHRRSPSGIVMGLKEVDGSLETVVPATGVEVDYLRAVRLGTRIQFRFKVPGTPVTINGVFTQVDVEIPMGDTVKFNMNFIGKGLPK